jgi:hypothetical protein
MDQLDQLWSHLPLKKRPIKEINVDYNDFNINFYENQFYVCDSYAIPKRRRIVSASSLSSNLSADNYSTDSGFIDNDSPLDLSSPCSLRRCSSPNIFKYDSEAVFGKFLLKNFILNERKFLYMSLRIIKYLRNTNVTVNEIILSIYQKSQQLYNLKFTNYTSLPLIFL